MAITSIATKEEKLRMQIFPVLGHATEDALTRRFDMSTRSRFIATSAAPDRMRRQYPKWMHLILTAMLVLGVGIGQGVAAPGGNPNKPIATKSGKKAALAQAAGAILQISAASAPASATDQTKVPHYFGPFPNWANSPFALPDAQVTIAAPDTTGTTATAIATVGAQGAVTAITV